MKKVLFIDRDGTLVIEPPIDYQLDSLEKLEFYPGVFQGLGKIVNELNYELVMVTNQDGLGTTSFPEDTFWPAQNKIIQAFKNEGIEFSEILIDKSFPNYGYLALIFYYMSIKEYFILFFLMFTSMQLYITYLVRQKTISFLQKILIQQYIVSFIFGLMCWLIDQFLCKNINDLPFHATWHIFSAYGMFSGFLSFIL